MKKLNHFLSTSVKNGYSPVCTDKPTSKIVLGLGALTGSGLDLSQIKWVPESNEQSDKFPIEPGDFLVSRSNTLDRVGRAALYRGGLLNCSYPDLMMKFRVDEEKILPDFMELILQSEPARKHFMRCASGTSSTMAKITKSVVESLKIPNFPVSQQKDIVRVARTWQNTIEKTEALISAKEKQFEWLCFSLTNDGTKKKLGDLFGNEITIEKGKSIVKAKVSIGKVPVVAGGQSYAYYHKVSTHTKSTITVSASGAYAGFVWLHHYPIWASDCNVISTDTECLDYIYYAIKSQQNKIYSFQSGGAQPHIYAKDLKNVSIALPLIDIQKKSSKKLNTARQEIDLLRDLLEKYRLQKRGLMQKLLTGEWQVNTPTKETPKKVSA